MSDRWFRCIGGGGGFAKLAIKDVLAADHRAAAHAYAADACKRGLGAGDIDVRVSLADDKRDPAQHFDLNVYMAPRVRARPKSKAPAGGWKAFYAAKRARGECTTCTAQAVEGYSRCEIHQEKLRAKAGSARTYAPRKRRAA